MSDNGKPRTIGDYNELFERCLGEVRRAALTGRGVQLNALTTFNRSFLGALRLDIERQRKAGFVCTDAVLAGLPSDTTLGSMSAAVLVELTAWLAPQNGHPSEPVLPVSANLVHEG